MSAPRPGAKLGVDKSFFIVYNKDVRLRKGENKMECEAYLKEINSIVNEFTSKFGCKAFLNEEFYYYPALEAIEYTLDFGRPSKPNKEFLTSVRRHKPQVKLNLFTWCLLHELGHHATEDDFDEEEMNRINKKRARVIKTKAHLPYYNLPDELAATTWAVNYANTHREEVLEFEDRIYGILKS